MTVPSIPSIFYEFAFNADPNQGSIPPYWTDLSARVQFGWKLTRGRQYELDANETGMWEVELANPDGALDPTNTASPYSPNVLPYRPCRIRVVIGNNLLIPDQASAGDYVGLGVGPLPWWLGVVPGVGSSLVISSVGGSAYQGSRVFAVTVPSGAAAPRDVLDVTVRQVTASQVYTFSVQAQSLTSGQNPTLNAAIDWIGATGAVLSTSSGSGSALTGAAGTWTLLTVTGTAPAAAVAATVRVVTATSPSANSLIWCDGLQLEARGYATRWQMPWTPGTNLLPQNIATGTETMNPVSDTVSSWFYATAGTLASVANLTAAPSGQSTALAWTLPAGSTTNYSLYLGVNTVFLAGPAVDCVQVTPGLSYTASAYFTRTGPDATVAVDMNISWFNSAGSQVNSSGGGSTTVPTGGSWVRATASGTAPAGAAWGRVFVAFTTPSTFTGTEVIYVTGAQVEQAASASTWADPGPACFLFTGMAERWPNTYNELDGTYATSKVECVDAFAGLAQPQLQSPFVNELVAAGATFAFMLNDPAGSTSCADAIGHRSPAPVENSPYGVGSLTFGNSITSTGSAGGFVGSPGPVATFNNSTAGPPYQNPETFVSIHKTTSQPGPPTSGGWTRIVHARCTSAPPSGTTRTIWFAAPSSPTSGVGFWINSSGQIVLTVSDPSAHVLQYTGGSVADGNWHQFVIAEDSSFNVAMYVDGAAVTPTGPAQTAAPSGVVTDAIGVYNIGGQARYSDGMVGDVAAAAELPYAVTSAQVTNLYNSWRTASAGESSGARYSRILKWLGWTGATAVDAGSTTQMGPATDTNGKSGLAALNDVAATENGDQYAAAGGALTFKARSALYGNRSPVVVFGEGQPVGNAGEWPCEIGSVDFDPARIANDVAVTQYQGATYVAGDATSRQRFFPRRFTRTVNTQLSSEAQNAATYLVSQLKNPRKRADVIRMHPAAVLGLFPILAQVDKNTRMRYIKRPIGAPSTTIDGYIQRIMWTWGADGDVFAEYQASPADLQNYWQLGALHTTLSAQANSGQNHVTINALPDAAVNKLAQSLPSGYSLTFEPGTARAETIAIAPGGIPSTLLGYSTATLTMNANLAFTHPSGSVVCEPLPTGYTNPATWDPSSVLGAAYAVITPPASQGGLGGTQLPIGPLSDAAVNAAVTDWYPGQTLWISPGTPQFQAQTLTAVSFTAPPWSIAILTFAALNSNWQFGDYICEPLPAGVTNPAALTPTARAAY